jgi:hypothetical protein
LCVIFAGKGSEKFEILGFGGVTCQGNRTKNISSHHGFRWPWMKRNVGSVLPVRTGAGCATKKVCAPCAMQNSWNSVSKILPPFLLKFLYLCALYFLCQFSNPQILK